MRRDAPKCTQRMGSSSLAIRSSSVAVRDVGRLADAKGQGSSLQRHPSGVCPGPVAGPSLESAPEARHIGKAH